jgi:CRISPR-associated protein Csx3
MNSYHINFVEDILHVSFDKDNPVTGDRIVRDAETCLEELISSGVLTGGSLLKINGRMSIPVSYTIAHKLGHLYSAIAVFDPRLKAYVVTISTNPEYQLGDRIDEVASSEVSPEACDDCAETNLKSSFTEENTNEYTFLLNLRTDNILKVGFNSKIPANGDQIVKDTAAQLEKLIESGKLKGKLLKISGRASILASFAIASKLAHCYGAIALFEPKEGNTGLDRYIVVISHSPNYRVGEAIDIESPKNGNCNAKVVLCGAPNTGKTVLRDGLKKAVRQQLNKPDDFFYAISGCPDGDYNWMSETAPELAKKLKEEYKAKFTPKFAAQKAQEIKNIKNPLLLFDIGGKITPENELITANATHAVILAKNEGEITEWQEFCQKLNISVIAIINSDYNGKEDRVEANSHILKGSVHHLERGEDVSCRPMIQALAEHIINLVK